MPEFLSDGWFDALDAAVRDDDRVGDLAGELDLVIQQNVSDTPPDGDQLAYHVVLTADDRGVRRGPADAPHVTFSTDHETAAAIATGRQSAQTAFVDGRLRVGGDLRRLLDAQASLVRLGDVFDSVPRATSADGVE